MPVAVVADGVVVVDAQGFQILDEAALQVAAAASLHRGVHQPLAPRHAVEVILLRDTPLNKYSKVAQGIHSLAALTGFL